MRRREFITFLDSFWMARRQRGRSVRAHNSIWRAYEFRNAALDLARITHVECSYSSPSGDAAAWMTPNIAAPVGVVVSRKTATRVTLGEICLSNSSHFPPMLYSLGMKPVTLPPGRARLSTDRKRRGTQLARYGSPAVSD